MWRYPSDPELNRDRASSHGWERAPLIGKELCKRREVDDVRALPNGDRHGPLEFHRNARRQMQLGRTGGTKNGETADGTLARRSLTAGASAPEKHLKQCRPKAVPIRVRDGHPHGPRRRLGEARAEYGPAGGTPGAPENGFSWIDVLVIDFHRKLRFFMTYSSRNRISRLGMIFHE
jgi:hypothetical protein